MLEAGGCCRAQPQPTELPARSALPWGLLFKSKADTERPHKSPTCCCCSSPSLSPGYLQLPKCPHVPWHRGPLGQGVDVIFGMKPHSGSHPQPRAACRGMSLRKESKFSPDSSGINLPYLLG